MTEKNQTPRVKTSDIEVLSNSRRIFDKAKMAELAESVRKHDVIEPLVVAPAPKGGGYILIAGERRLRAAVAAGLKDVPVTIREASAEQAQQLQAVENLQREDLTPIEEADALLRIVSARFGVDKIKGLFDHAAQVTVDKETSFAKKLPSKEFEEAVRHVARETGRSFAHVGRMLRLNELPMHIKDLINDGKLVVEHGWLYLTVPGEFRLDLDAWIEDAVKSKDKATGWGSVGRADRTISVTSMERFLDEKVHKDLRNAPFPTNEPFAGELACTACPFNTACQSALFPTAEAGKCRQPKCWGKKREHVYRQLREALAKSKQLEGLTFSGYGRLIKPYSGQAEMPTSIGGYPVLGQKIPKEMQSAWDDAKARLKTFGWAIVKPAEDSPKPSVKVVYVLRDVEALGKAAQRKVEKQMAQPDDAKDEGRALIAFHQAVVGVLTQVTVNQLIPKLKHTSLKGLLVSALDEWELRRNLQRVAGLLNIKAKTREDLEKLSEEKLSVLVQGLRHAANPSGVEEQLKKAHQQAIIKAFQLAKDRVTYKEYRFEVPADLAGDVARSILAGKAWEPAPAAAEKPEAKKKGK